GCRLRGRPCGVRPDDESRIPEKACVTKNHARHSDVLDGLDEGVLSRADQLGEAWMNFSLRCGVQSVDEFGGGVARRDGGFSLLAVLISKENGEVRCLIGLDVPDPIETAPASVYGSVLAWDKVAENVPT